MNTNKYKEFSQLIAVNEQTEGILGKLVYYSISNILIDKLKFQQIGVQFGLAKIKPFRESSADAFRNATSSIYERIEGKDSSGKMQIYRIYCRDNKREDADRVYRELVKETLGSSTNDYKKLANIYFDKQQETVGYENVCYDYDADPYVYCDKAVELFDVYRVCYTRNHVDTVIESLLSQMEATKISVHGKLYFVPAQHLQMVDVLEEFVEEINLHNQSDLQSNHKKRFYGSEITANSIYVADDEKQRTKMMQEFYASYKKDIDFYMERIQHFINTGATSDTVINRWLLRIDALLNRKATYETVLKQELNELNDEFSLLQLQSQELRVRTESFQSLKRCA